MASSLLARLRMLPRYLRSRIGSREVRIWVFGNEKGFRDGPRYLAEHIRASNPELTPVWIARSQPEIEQARSAGLQVVMRGSSESERIHRRAAAAFICHGFQDVEAVHLGGACIVHLFHGTALKRTGLDVDFLTFAGRSMRVRLLERLHRWSLALGWSQVRIFVAASEIAKPRYVSSFGVSPSRVQVLGTPRFDVIRGGDAYERAAGGDLRAVLGLQRGDTVVLWLPTWRERGDAAWLPTLDHGMLETALAGTNIVLLVKPHPYSDHAVYRARLPDHPRLRLLGEAEVDVNCLLHLADQLVTDYSSAAFDFAILRRPIHFLAPDIAEYGRGRDFYEPFESFTSGSHHADWPTLLYAIVAASTGEDAASLANAERISQRTGNRDAPGSSERIVLAVKRELGVSPPQTAAESASRAPSASVSE